MGKQIIIVNEETKESYILTNSFDIFELYNQWLADINENISLNSNLDTIKQIRDWHYYLWNSIPAGTYTIKEFEKCALCFL